MTKCTDPVILNLTRDLGVNLAGVEVEDVAKRRHVLFLGAHQRQICQELCARVL